jgi:hypothetical protein
MITIKPRLIAAISNQVVKNRPESTWNYPFSFKGSLNFLRVIHHWSASPIDIICFTPKKKCLRI